MSVTVTTEGLPFTATVAPINGSPSESTTVPLTVIPSWACSEVLNAKSIKIAGMACLTNCFRFFILTDFDSCFVITLIILLFFWVQSYDYFFFYLILFVTRILFFVTFVM
jgi:hypothetical protein